MTSVSSGISGQDEGGKVGKCSNSRLKVTVVISRLLWKKSHIIWPSWQSALPTTVACSLPLGCSVLEEYGHCNWRKRTDSLLLVEQVKYFQSYLWSSKRKLNQGIRGLLVLFLQSNDIKNILSCSWFQQWIFSSSAAGCFCFLL